MQSSQTSTKETLILHIGYHKTGTTTLQKLVFPHLCSVAYFHNKDISPATAEAQFKAAFSRSPQIWRVRGPSIFDLLLSETSEKTRSVLISGESMAMHRIFAAPGTSNSRSRDPFLLAAHLHECQTAARRFGFDALKVIIGIRRQDQYFASRYASHGWLAPNPGQRDFETQLLAILDPEDRYYVDGVWLDYRFIRELIAEVVGDVNILMLPLEQLSRDAPGYLASLSAFVGERLDPNTLGLKRTNVRAVAPDVWRIKAASIRRSLRKKPFGRIRAYLAGPVEITLTPELKERVLTTYREGNELLAATLNLDLTTCGYLGQTRHSSKRSLDG